MWRPTAVSSTESLVERSSWRPMPAEKDRNGSVEEVAARVCIAVRRRPLKKKAFATVPATFLWAGERTEHFRGGTHGWGAPDLLDLRS